MVHDSQPSAATPWKRRFEALHLLDLKIAPAAYRGLVISKQSGVSQLYAWDLARNTMRQLTDRVEGVLEGFLSPDGRFVYYLDDHRGNEIGHFVRIAFEGSSPEDVTPTLPPHAPAEFVISTDGSTAAFIAANSDTYTLYTVALHSKEHKASVRSIYESSIFMWGATVSYSGDIAVFASSERTKSPEYSLFALDTQNATILGELWDGPQTSIWPVSFAPVTDHAWLLAMSDRTGTMRPLVWDVGTGERYDLELDLEGEVRPIGWSPDGTCILLDHLHRAIQRLYLYILPERRVIRLNHPSGTIKTACFGPEGQIFVLWQDEKSPPQILELDGMTGQLNTVAVPAPEVPLGQPWRSIDIRSSDGQYIQAWVGQPEGVGPFPTVIHLHGGPAMCVTQSFLPELQAWLDHGFAICSVNYRGSTTFGRTFSSQIYGNPGALEIEDLLTARAWLVEHGIAQPQQIFLTGHSYGGYLSLLALGKHPDLWAGGMVSSPITDWTIQYEDSSGRMRGYQAAFLGGTPQEQPERYRQSSPSTYVEQVQAPVLIIQGVQDSRTPHRATEAYVAKMQVHRKAVEVHWFDAGHGGVGANMQRDIERQSLMLQFARRVVR